MGFSCPSQACSERAEWSGIAWSLSEEGDLGQMDLAAAQPGSGNVAVWGKQGFRARLDSHGALSDTQSQA